MRKIYSFVLAGALIIFAAGCGTVPINAEQNQDVQQAAEQSVCGKLVAEAIAKNDYSLIKGRLSQEMTKLMAEDKFQALLKQLGKYGKIDSISFVTKLRSTPMNTEVWKISFSKKAKDDNPIFNDKLLHVTTCIISGKEEIFAITIM